MTLKVLDLFSGIGGFSYGLERVRFRGQKVFETVAFCEINKECHPVLRKHWPEVEIFEDVSKLSYSSEFGVLCQKNLFKTKFGIKKKIDVICGGFPCQDISVAGKKKGLVDENGERTRSGLWFEYKRLISEIRPRWVLIENVRNLLSNGFSTVIKDLSEIGYSAEWEVISAASVGSSHLRERIWIIAYPNKYSLREQSRGRFWESGGDKIPSRSLSEGGEIETSDSDYFRFWPSFASEKEKSEWWTKASSEFRHWWKTQPEICGVYDGLSAGLDRGSLTPEMRRDERARQARIKQLGNSIVPFIAQLHGERIAYHEFDPIGML